VKVCIKLPNDMTGEVTLPVNLPYDITKYLIGECGLKIDDTLLSKYWRHKETTLDPLAVATRNYRQMAGTVWPLGFYGDEAAMGLVNAPMHQIFGLYMNVPLYRPRSTRLSRFLLFSVEVEKIISVEETIYPVLEAIVESFNQLTSVGVCGLRFLVSEIRGDQAFFRMMFKHRSWWTATKMCFRVVQLLPQGPGTIASTMGMILGYPLSVPLRSFWLKSYLRTKPVTWSNLVFVVLDTIRVFGNLHCKFCCCVFGALVCWNQVLWWTCISLRFRH